MRMLVIGECMVELTRIDGNNLTMGFAGDTVNTAVYLNRLSGEHAEVRYLTATGDDELSVAQLKFMRDEGLVVTAQLVPGASPALYIISTDEQGERSFTYYREASPVRALFIAGSARTGELVEAFESVDLIYFSAITLQMLQPQARDRLYDLTVAARAGGARVAFDSNFRARGWATPDMAVAEIKRVAAFTDIVLPTLGDEQLLHSGATADSVIEFYRDAGVSEVIVKDGANEVFTWSQGKKHGFMPLMHPAPVDTTGAGDSFNAGYLHARLFGATVTRAVISGHKLAYQVIGQKGAIIKSR